jgi:hypothetical protein
VGCSELPLSEVALAFPARRERDGAEFKERQGGLPGIVRAHKVPLWDGRELVAKHQGIPAAERRVADEVVEVVIAELGEDVEPIRAAANVQPPAVVFQDQGGRGVAIEPAKGRFKRLRRGCNGFVPDVLIPWGLRIEGSRLERDVHMQPQVAAMKR